MNLMQCVQCNCCGGSIDGYVGGYIGSQLAELAVRRAKIFSPLYNAMGFINHDAKKVLVIDG